MGKYNNWIEFKVAMKKQNEQSRTNLRQRHEAICMMQELSSTDSTPCQKDGADCLQDTISEEPYIHMRDDIIRSLWNVVPLVELRDSTCCVLVSLEELCAVRSLSPADYLVKTQVALITEALMRCKTSAALTAEIDYLDLTGRIFDGTHFLILTESVQSVLRRYASSAISKTG